MRQSQIKYEQYLIRSYLCFEIMRERYARKILSNALARISNGLLGAELWLILVSNLTNRGLVCVSNNLGHMSVDIDQSWHHVCRTKIQNVCVYAKELLASWWCLVGQSLAELICPMVQYMLQGQTSYETDDLVFNPAWCGLAYDATERAKLLPPLWILFRSKIVQTCGTGIPWHSSLRPSNHW